MATPVSISSSRTWCCALIPLSSSTTPQATNFELRARAPSSFEGLSMTGSTMTNSNSTQPMKLSELYEAVSEAVAQMDLSVWLGSIAQEHHLTLPGSESAFTRVYEEV